MQQTYGWLNNCLHRIFKNSLFAILILSWLTLLFYKCDCTKWGWLLIKLNKFSCEWFWWKMHFLKLLQLITTESFQVYWIWIVVLRLFKIIFKNMTLLLKWKLFLEGTKKFIQTFYFCHCGREMEIISKESK